VIVDVVDHGCWLLIKGRVKKVSPSLHPPNVRELVRPLVAVLDASCINRVVIEVSCSSHGERLSLGTLCT
jgi:hypothetical protein